MKTTVLAKISHVKFSSRTVHEKHIFAISVCVLKGRKSMDKQNCVGQSQLCSYFVLKSASPMRLYIIHITWVESSTRGKEIRVQSRGRVFEKSIILVFLNRSTKWTYWVDMPGVLWRSYNRHFSNLLNAGVGYYTRGVKDCNFYNIRC